MHGAFFVEALGELKMSFLYFLPGSVPEVGQGGRSNAASLVACRSREDHGSG